MSDRDVARRAAERLEQAAPEPAQAAGDELEVRRARRPDVPAIVTLVRQATAGKQPVDEAAVLGWLFGKGLLVALDGERLAGVATWQAENLLSVTDLLHVYPARLRAAAGRRLLQTIEAEANVLMCEANVVILPPGAARAVRTFLHKQGYEPKAYQELHRIWREVLTDFNAGQPELMVKRLRDKMVMAPF